MSKIEELTKKYPEINQVPTNNVDVKGIRADFHEKNPHGRFKQFHNRFFEAWKIEFLALNRDFRQKYPAEERKAIYIAFFKDFSGVKINLGWHFDSKNRALKSSIFYWHLFFLCKIISPLSK